MKQVRFDHPERPMPRLGPHISNARLDLPPPARWMTLYLTERRHTEVFLLVWRRYRSVL